MSKTKDWPPLMVAAVGMGIAVAFMTVAGLLFHGILWMRSNLTGFQQFCVATLLVGLVAGVWAYQMARAIEEERYER
jgi:uncharacterized integral membrane protein